MWTNECGQPGPRNGQPRMHVVGYLGSNQPRMWSLKTRNVVGELEIGQLGPRSVRPEM